MVFDNIINYKSTNSHTRRLIFFISSNHWSKKIYGTQDSTSYLNTKTLHWFRGYKISPSLNLTEISQSLPPQHFYIYHTVILALLSQTLTGKINISRYNYKWLTSMYQSDDILGHMIRTSTCHNTSLVCICYSGRYVHYLIDNNISIICTQQTNIL